MARNKYDVDEVLEDRFDINQLKRLGKYVAPYKKKNDSRYTYNDVILRPGNDDTEIFPEGHGRIDSQ